MKKITIPVFIIAQTAKFIGEIEIEKLEDYEDKANELWEKSGCEPILKNASNDFDMLDSDLQEFSKGDFDFYKEEQMKKG